MNMISPPLNPWDTIIITMHCKILIVEGINLTSPVSMTRKIALTLTITRLFIGYELSISFPHYHFPLPWVNAIINLKKIKIMLNVIIRYQDTSLLTKAYGGRKDLLVEQSHSNDFQSCSQNRLMAHQKCLIMIHD
jgi:hypothetical protein